MKPKPEPRCNPQDRVSIRSNLLDVFYDTLDDFEAAYKSRSKTLCDCTLDLSPTLSLALLVRKDPIQDRVRFRLILKRAPPPPEGGGEEETLERFEMKLQMNPNKSASQIYQLSVHTMMPDFQVHIAVSDHTVAFHAPNEDFHRWHPLMACVQNQPGMRILVRMKPDGSGPLGDMCGCC